MLTTSSLCAAGARQTTANEAAVTQ